jgi:hypothetical protein
MATTDLQGVADAVVRRAESQGYVVAKDVRDELAKAGLAQAQWKDVLELAKPSLRYRQRRYYYEQPGLSFVRDHPREDQRQKREVHQAIRDLIRRYQERVVEDDRRMLGRIHFIQPIQVVTEDQRELNCVSRDLSVNGMRLLGKYNLVGQRVRVWIPRMEEEGTRYCFLVQILWSSQIGDDLFENGGFFLEIAEG